MRRFLLDTGIASDLIYRRRGIEVKVREARLRGDRIGTCYPVVGELFAGADWSSSRERNLSKIQTGLAGFICWPFDRAAAEEYGRLYAELRRVGRPMQQIDIQVAAVAMALGHTTVVSADSDLASVPGLSVENWAEP